MRSITVGAWLCCVLACQTPQSVRDESSCETVCRCLEPNVPSVQEECISACVEDLGPIDDDCASCIAEHANECSTLENDCFPLC